LEISVSTDILAHEWPIYRYRPQKSNIGQCLAVSDFVSDNKRYKAQTVI